MDPGTRRGRRSAGALLAVVSAAALLHQTPVAAAGSPDPTTFGERATAFVRQHRAGGAGGMSMAALPVGQVGQDGRVEAAAVCAEASFVDALDAPHLDATTYGIDYDCDDRTYRAAVGTADTWVPEELDYYEVVMDTDADPGNGCFGGDHAVVAFWDGDDGFLAAALRTPSCDSATWTDRGDVVVGRASAHDFIGVAFTADQIGSPSVSRWYQALSGIFNPGEDLLPDDGMKTLAVPGTGVSPAAPAATGAAAQTVFGYGPATNRGSTGATPLNAPLVGMAPTPTGGGYWLLGGDGGIFSYGDAAFHGSTGGRRLNQPVVSLAGDPEGRGYWFVAADGGIFSFGAPFFGSTGGRRLNQPVVGLAATRSGAGYWLVAADGGVFSFGDARFAGSTGGIRLNQPVVGMAADPDGAGYWFVAADGGVFAFDAPFSGSPVGRLAAGDRVVSMAANPAGGYWVTSAQGAVFPFGAAAQHGGAAGQGRAIAAIAAHPTNGGYWLLASE